MMFSWNTMALLSKTPLSLVLLGLPFAWLAEAQTETVYLTHVQYIYTACECFGTAPDVFSSTTTSLPTGPTATLTGTFPTFGFSSTGTTTGVPSSLTSKPLGSPSSGAETVASVVTLSNGLGPLLSSDTSTTPTSASSINSTSSLPTDTVSTSIRVISSTIAPTAASSHLTTSGVPGSLSVNLSDVTSNPALASSAALISFGTSSPAVFSTVLPSGMSMGTSSVAITTHSTIALNSVSLTGVTLLAPRSPTSCYTLPTPASSMDMIAVAVVPLDDFDLSNPMILALGDNGTTPQYVSAFASGNPYVLNLSPNNPVTGQLGLQIPGDDVLVFDGSGMSLYTGNCSSLTQVLVENFYGQLSLMHGTASHRRAAAATLLQKRQTLNSSTFDVQVAVDSYLNTPYFSPNLTFGDNQCTLGVSTMGTTTDNISWSCEYPPPVGGVASCASRLNNWLNDMTVPSESPGSTTEVLATLGPFLASAGNSILDLFPGSDPALGMGFTFMQQAEAAARGAVGYAGSSPCDVIHAFDSDELVIEDGGPLGTQTLGSFITAPPPSLSINLAASATAAIASLPPRKANPTDTFLDQVATDFKNIVSAFTQWLHGLPLLGGLIPPVGMEETGSPPPRTMPASTIVTTTAATLTTPSVVHVIMPTVTVTHVLGAGWFNPSTHVVGPGTRSEAASSSPDTTSISLEEFPFGTSPSSPTFASSQVVDDVVSQLESMGIGDPGVQTGRRWDLPNPQSSETSTTTPGDLLGYDGHVVLVTTTVTIFNATTL